MIEAHPDVHALGWASKELHYFDRFNDRAFGPAEISAYHEHFRRPSAKVCGEWTPRYMYDPWTPALLRQAAPQAKLLVMLRDPVARFESGLSHDLEAGADRHDAWGEAFARGRYFHQLERLLSEFPRDQILVSQFERCATETGPMLDRTFAFLGVAPEKFTPRMVRSAVNQRRGPPANLTGAERARLCAAYEDDVLLLSGAFPELDLGLWSNFRHLA